MLINKTRLEEHTYLEAISTERGTFGDHRDTFISQGCNGWKKNSKTLTKHKGQVNSLHNKCLKKCDNLLNEKQSIKAKVDKRTKKEKHEYRVRLDATCRLTKNLINQGAAFRSNDETKVSLNEENFLEFLELMGEINEDLGKLILGNAPGNNQMTSPKIQNDLKHCFAQEILKQIFEDIGGDVFSLLVDESSDVSKNEQMVVVIRYVNKCWVIKEQFIGLVHVMEMSALILKSAIDDLLGQNGLSLARISGQCYVGASNTSGELNGLRALILKDNASAFYAHCLAHQLQLVVVAIATKNSVVWRVFEMVGTLTNVICASCKRQDKLRKNQKEYLQNNLITTGSRLNQELSLSRAGDTRWNSYYKKHLNFILVYCLLKLALILPVATATFERSFSAMEFVKNNLRNRIGNENLNDSCIAFIEKDLLKNVEIEDVIYRFQKIKTPREQL